LELKKYPQQTKISADREHFPAAEIFYEGAKEAASRASFR